MPHARRKDNTHSAIVAALRGVGAEVQEVYRFPGMLDVIVGWRGKLYWAELKTGKAGATAAEEDVISRFARVGVHCPIWRSADEALHYIGAIEW